MTSPLIIQVAFAHHCSGNPEDYMPKQQWMSRAAVEAREFLAAEGIILDGRITNKGRAWIDMICATPFPTLKFVDPRFERGGQ